MVFNKKDYDNIYQAMVERINKTVPQLTDFEEGSVVRGLFESFSREMASLYEQMGQVYDAGFVDTASGDDLERLVANLGLKRNQADFAGGSVTFKRESFYEGDLVIPEGTLVTTAEDVPAGIPRKGFVTTEPGELKADNTEIEVTVRAGQRGPEMVTDAETIVLMPSPILGVNSVINKKPVILVGRQDETDEELRKRGQNALLTAGGASVKAIENTILAMSGIRSVRSFEDFETYQITQSLIRRLENCHKISPDITSQLNSLTDKMFTSKEVFKGYLDKTVTNPTLNEEVQSIIIEEAFTVSPGRLIVYVDGLTPSNINDIQNRVNQVRSAGSFVNLVPVEPIYLDGILKIEVPEYLSEEEALAVEETVRDVIKTFTATLTMGDSLIFSHLMKQVLDTRWAEDLEAFEFQTCTVANTYARGRVCLRRKENLKKQIALPRYLVIKTQLGHRYLVQDDVVINANKASREVEVQAFEEGLAGELYRTEEAISWETLELDGVCFEISNDAPILLERKIHKAKDKRISAGYAEKIVPRLIRVASQQKKLPVNIQIKLVQGDLAAKKVQIKKEITSFFKKLKVGQSFDKKDLRKGMKSLSADDSLRLLPQLHQGTTSTEVVAVSFIEKACAGTLFLYQRSLQLKGAIRLVLAPTSTAGQQEQSQAWVFQKVEDFLECLKPEDNIDVAAITKIAAGGPGVLRVQTEPYTLVELGTKKVVPDRLKDGLLRIDAGEKVFLSEMNFSVKSVM